MKNEAHPAVEQGGAVYDFRRSEDHVKSSTHNWLPAIQESEPKVRQELGGKGAICEETLGMKQNLLSSKNTQPLRRSDRVLGRNDPRFRSCLSAKCV